ncbi:MAG: molybdenum cofactor biosynthesis protein MoaE [Acidobacteriota bacterium]
MRVKVLFFGPVKDIAGRSSDEIDVPPGSSLQTIFDRYATPSPELRKMGASILMARNQEFASRDTLLADGDEVAFLPPVSGGAGEWSHSIETPAGHFFGLTRQPIDGGTIARQLLAATDGAFVNFEGVVRNNSKGRATRYLDYECYEAMAIQVMAKLGAEIAAAHEIGRIAMVHRLGRLEIGETSVAVVVTSPHRRAAFDAALEGINRLKKTVPVWKKEYFADGEVWVEGDWDESLLQS